MGTEQSCKTLAFFYFQLSENSHTSRTTSTTRILPPKPNNHIYISSRYARVFRIRRLPFKIKQLHHLLSVCWCVSYKKMYSPVKITTPKPNNYTFICSWCVLVCMLVCIVQKDVFSSQKYHPKTQQLHLHLFLVCSYCTVHNYTFICSWCVGIVPFTITPSSGLGVLVLYRSQLHLHLFLVCSYCTVHNYTFICSWCVGIVPFKKTYFPLHSDLSIVYMCVYACVCVGMCMWACVMQAVSAAVGGVAALQSAGKIYHKSHILKTQ